MRAARVDANHAAIVDALRRAGCSVQSLAAVGGGCPDLLIGFRGRNLLLECKDGEKRPSARGLNDAQMKWHSLWRGDVWVVRGVPEALQAVGL